MARGEETAGQPVAQTEEVLPGSGLDDLIRLSTLILRVKAGYKQLKTGATGSSVEIPPITLDLGAYDVVLEGPNGTPLTLRRK